MIRKSGSSKISMDIAQSLSFTDERLRKAGGSGDGTDSISHTETETGKVRVIHSCSSTLDSTLWVSVLTGYDIALLSLKVTQQRTLQLLPPEAEQERMSSDINGCIFIINDD